MFRLALLALALIACASSSLVPIELQPIATSSGQFFASIVTLNVGTPGLQYRVAVDGGFDWTMLNSAQCSDSLCLQGPRYSAVNSSTANVGAEFSASYGFGLFRVFGNVVNDVASFDRRVGSTAEFVAVTRYKVAAFGDTELDNVSGSLGVAFPNAANNLSFVDALDARRFSIELSALGSDGDGSGQLVLGDDVPVSSSVHWIDVRSSSWAGHPGLYYWSSKLDDVRVGGASTLNCRAFGVSCNFFVDPAGGNLVLAGYPKAPSEPLDCNAIDALPTIGIVIDGVTYELEPRDYVLVNTSAGTCQSTVSPAPAASFSVLGTTWLRKFRTVFDVDSKRFGFDINR
jgi:Eukaryotic aspartyl protease